MKSNKSLAWFTKLQADRTENFCFICRPFLGAGIANIFFNTYVIKWHKVKSP